MSIAISLEHVSKIYRLGQIGTGTLSRDLEVWWARLRGKPNPLLRIGEREHANPQDDALLALRDVNFTVEQGDALGIIGRNGAGKSTLLKILSRVTAPTTGKVKVKGRIASLLEVGTGFHPELTGRENIQLNGAILGMSSAEIRRKFDEIVNFAEVEKFIDTPVKRYSSGMYVRLAFAVAAHLEAEILVMDEVLAVGDAEFQKKCLGKMGDVTQQGRTVLFVSHNMGAVTRLCRHAVWLEAGSVALMGDAIDVTNQYLVTGAGMTSQRHWDSPEKAPGDDVARLKSVRALSDGGVSDAVDIRKPVVIEMEYWNYKPEADLLAAFSFINEQGQILFVSADFNGDGVKRPGVHRARCSVPGNLFAEGRISVVAEVSTRHPVYQIHFLEWDSVCFNVIDQGQPGSVRADWGRNIPGLLRPALHWESEFLG